MDSTAPHNEQNIPQDMGENPIVPSVNSLMAQIQELKSKNAWSHIIASFHPLAEKHPGIASDPGAHQIESEIAFALSQQHSFDEAITILKKCLEVYPGDYRYLSALAFNYYNALMADKSREISLGERRQQYFQNAHNALVEAEKIFPESVVDFYRHGMLYHHLSSAGDRKATRYFLQAIENWENMEAEAKHYRQKDHKNYIKSLYHLAKSYIRLGEGEKALDAIERCICEDEGLNHEEVVHKFYITGKAHALCGDLQEAVKFLRVAANQRTRRPKDYIFESLARCLMQLCEYDKAQQWLERIPPRYRKPYVLRLYAILLSKTGTLKQAEIHFREALKRDRQGKHKTFLAWGIVLFERKNYLEALDLFRRANEARRKNFAGEYPEALYYIGQCRQQLGDNEKAIASYRAVLALNDRHHLAARHLRTLLQEQQSDRKHSEGENDLTMESNYDCAYDETATQKQ